MQCKTGPISIDAGYWQSARPPQRSHPFIELKRQRNDLAQRYRVWLKTRDIYPCDGWEHERTLRMDAFFFDTGLRETAI